MNFTHGIFLVNELDQLLIVHPTNSRWNNWSIPKGLKDGSESDLNTILRELKEETNIDISLDSDFIQLPDSVYRNNKKTLRSVFLKTCSSLLVGVELYCSSIVDGKDFPENDVIKWIEISKCEKILHESQSRLLEQVKQLSKSKGQYEY